MKPLHIKIFLIWTVLLNWPPVLIWLPSVRVVCAPPFYLWINIPGLCLGELIGWPHYEFHELGVWPKTVFSWVLTMGFWLLVAAVLTAATVYFRRLRHGRQV